MEQGAYRGEEGKSSVRYYRCGKSHITPDCSSSTSSSLTAFVMIQERHSHPNPFITINIQQGTSMSLLRLTAPTAIQGSLHAFLARFDEDGTNEHSASHFCSKILGSLFFFSLHLIPGARLQVLAYIYVFGLLEMCLGSTSCNFLSALVPCPISCWKCVWVQLPVIFQIFGMFFMFFVFKI